MSSFRKFLILTFSHFLPGEELNSELVGAVFMRVKHLSENYYENKDETDKLDESSNYADRESIKYEVGGSTHS